MRWTYPMTRANWIRLKVDLRRSVAADFRLEGFDGPARWHEKHAARMDRRANHLTRRASALFRRSTP